MARLSAETSSKVGGAITAVSSHAQDELATHLACFVSMTNGAADGDLQLYDIVQARSIRWPPGSEIRQPALVSLRWRSAVLVAGTKVSGDSSCGHLRGLPHQPDRRQGHLLARALDRCH